VGFTDLKLVLGSALIIRWAIDRASPGRELESCFGYFLDTPMDSPGSTANLRFSNAVYRCSICRCVLQVTVIDRDSDELPTFMPLSVDLNTIIIAMAAPCGQDCYLAPGRRLKYCLISPATFLTEWANSRPGDTIRCDQQAKQQLRQVCCALDPLEECDAASTGVLIPVSRFLSECVDEPNSPSARRIGIGV
jgi:hypothetical protein